MTVTDIYIKECDKMKRVKYIAAVLSLCLLCGCSEKAVTAGVTEQSETETSVTTSEAVTESTTSEAVTEKPAVAYREDNELESGYSDDNILYYASHGLLNEGCKINGIEAEIEWEGSADKTYIVKMYDEDYALFLEQTVEGNFFNISGLDTGIYLSANIFELTDDGSENYIKSVYLHMSDVSDCGDISISYNDDDRYVFTWEPVENAEYYLIFVDNNEYYDDLTYLKTVVDNQATITDFCPGQKKTIAVVPARKGADGKIIYGGRGALDFVPVKSGDIATAEYVSGSESIEHKGRIIYTFDYDYPVIKVSDSAASQKINDRIKELAIIECDEDEIKQYADDLIGSAFEDAQSYDASMVKIVNNTEDMLTVYAFRDVYNAGAVHGYYWGTYSHFDPKTGEYIKFNDVFDRKALYNDLKEKMMDQLYAAYDYDYTPSEYDYESLDNAFSEGYLKEDYSNGLDWLDTHWFYDNDTLTIYFDVYQMGSYAEGIKSVSFGYDEIKGYILNKDVLK